MVYSYRALTSEGLTTTGATEASDEKSAIEKLRDMGLIPVSLDEPKQGLGRPLHVRSSKQQLLLFTTELSVLLTAGLPLDRSLAMLAEASDNKEMRETIQFIVKSLREGHAFSDALQLHPKVFPVSMSTWSGLVKPEACST
jgi:type II secretory pathway component PulF